MTSTEFLLGIALNTRWVFATLCFCSGIALFISSLIVVVLHSAPSPGTKDSTPEEKRLGRRVWLLSFAVFIISVIPANIPDVQDLWKIRIGMIKLQLASPENVQRGAEEIIRIGKKLECRYLGCDEQKK